MTDLEDAEGQTGALALRPRAIRRLGVALAATLGIAVLSPLAMTPARADVAPPVGTPETVSADPLPTAQVNGVVFRTAIVGNTVYAAGSFSRARPAGTAIGSAAEVARTNLMSFDLVTGALSSWAPILNGNVMSVKASPDGSTLYVGGDFTTVNGSPRSRIAAFSTATGALVAGFAPTVSGQVRAIAVTPTRVYFGGQFGAVNGTNRSRAASVNVGTSTLNNWNPSADDVVEALLASPTGDRIVIGGRFQNLAGAPKVGIGAVDGATGAALAWSSTPIPTKDPNGGRSWVTDLSLLNGVVYAAANGEGGHWYDGRFAADFATGDLVWLDNCYGATTGIYAVGQVVYSASHAHDCSSVNSFPQTEPWTYYRALAETTYAVGNDQTPPSNGSNYSNQPIPQMLHWYPSFGVGTYTGTYNGPWSVDGSGDYVVFGGEFPNVNGVAQQGLVRFIRPGAAPKKSGPLFYTTLKPTALSLTPGSVRVTWPQTWDRDSATLKYELFRNFSTTPIYTTTVTSSSWTLTSPTVPSGPNLRFTDTGLAAGVSVSYRLKVSDSNGNNLDNLRSATVTVTNQLPSAYQQAVLGDAPSSYWRLGGGTGLAPDYSGYDDLGSGVGVTGSAPGAITGDSNAASNFDGTSTSFAASSQSQAGPDRFTAEAWFKTTSTTGGKIIGFGNSATGDSSNYDRHVYLSDDGTIIFGVHPGGVRTVNSGSGYNDGQWHQVVATLDPTDGMVLFVDGRRVARDAGTTSAQGYAGVWRIGGDNLGGWPNGPSNNRFIGSIDEVAVYPVALGAAQVNSHWIASGRTSSLTPVPSDLYGTTVMADAPAAYLRLNESSGGNAWDSSGAENNAIYVGGVTRAVSGALKTSADKAIHTDGVNGGMYLAAPQSNPSNYSEEVWFKTSTTSGGKIIGFGANQTGGSGGYDRHVYMQDNGQVVFGVWTGSPETITTPNVLNDNLWHHLVATQSSTSGMALYVDGVLQGTNPTTWAQDYTGYWRVGGDTTWGSSSAYINADIDEVAIYNSVLSPARVKAHYYAGLSKTPTASFTAAMTQFSLAVDASASADPDGTVVSYAWTFGDGGTATGATATHDYATPGNYDVTLTVTDDSGTQSSLTKTVTALPTLPADAYGAAVVTDFPLAYWRLNDASGTTAADSSGQHNDGALTGGVTLGSLGSSASVGDASASFDGNDGGVYLPAAQNNPIPYSTELWFKTNTTVGGKLIGFSDQQSGLSNNYDRHVYMQDDGRIVFGVWTGQPNTITSSGSLNDNVWHHMVATQSPTAGMALYVDGVLQGTNPQTQAQGFPGFWRVGGDRTWGSSSSYFQGLIDEVAIYPTALTAERVAAHYNLVTPNVAPVAGFTATPTDLSVAFDGSGSSDADGTIASYAWSFGDGASDTGVSPSHTYASSGTYTVTLTVTDNRGATDVKTDSVTVTVVAPNVAPVAGFTATPTDLSVAFDGSGSSDADGTIASYAWSFGDGASDTGVSPSHTYASSGTYTVTLTVTDNRGATDVKTDSVTVTVVAPNVAPVAGFTATPTDLSVAFDGSGSSDADGTIASYAWSFGDGASDTGVSPSHTYASSGTYTVTLTVTDNRGATDVKTDSVTVTVVAPNVAPVAGFTATPTDLSVAFDGSGSSDADGTVASYAWSFGDGTGTSTVAKPSYVYASAGTYTVSLTVTDNRGGTDTKTDSVTVVAPNVAPVAGFTATPTDLSVAFDGSGSSDADGTVASYAWSFGDGTGTSTVAKPSYVYASAGTYTVSLTVTDNRGGTDTKTDSVTVVAPNVAPVAGFTATPTDLSVAFDGSGSSDADGTIASYAWSFGDGTGTSTVAKPTYVYASAGTYSVKLTVTDNRGGTDTKTTSVTVTSPVLAQDAFGRTTASGLGAADIGGAWSTTSAASLFSVSGGVGRISHAAAATGRTGFLGGISSAATDVSMTFSADKASSGGGFYYSLIGRRIAGTGDYRAKARVLANGTVGLSLVRVNAAGVETAIRAESIIPGLTAVANTPLRIRVQVLGSAPTTVRAKVWNPTSTEPAAWQASVTDATAGFQVAGSIGFMTYISGSSTTLPVAIRLDDLYAVKLS